VLNCGRAGSGTTGSGDWCLLFRASCFKALRDETDAVCKSSNAGSDETWLAIVAISMWTGSQLLVICGWMRGCRAGEQVICWAGHDVKTGVPIDVGECLRSSLFCLSGSAQGIL
jgi:hypothetical protein